MQRRFEDARILMYSHDTFGLGHLRRCRTIAHALVEEYRGLSVLIVSGATIAGAFDYRSRVDFVKVPSVIKLRNGEYTSLASHINLSETLKMRQSIIRHTAETFQPDIFIVDKEPMGLRGEVEETLSYLKKRGTRLVLGLREVMDAPHLLDAEWKQRDVMQKINQYYDAIWVYGPPDFYDPLVSLDVPLAVREKMTFVGYLQSVSTGEDSAHRPEGDYLLVTTGGGGDGADLVHDVIEAYRHDPTLTQKTLIVLGPYMKAKQRLKLTRKAAKIPHIKVIQFDNRMEELIAGATAVLQHLLRNRVVRQTRTDRAARGTPAGTVDPGAAGVGTGAGGYALARTIGRSDATGHCTQGTARAPASIASRGGADAGRSDPYRRHRRKLAERGGC
jgi:predicted glycosyltransferase